MNAQGNCQFVAYTSKMLSGTEKARLAAIAKTRGLQLVRDRARVGLNNYGPVIREPLLSEIRNEFRAAIGQRVFKPKG